MDWSPGTGVLWRTVGGPALLLRLSFVMHACEEVADWRLAPGLAAILPSILPCSRLSFLFFLWSDVCSRSGSLGPRVGLGRCPVVGEGGVRRGASVGFSH